MIFNLFLALAGAASCAERRDVQVYFSAGVPAIHYRVTDADRAARQPPE